MAQVHGPRCPNHNVPLILTDTPGIGICPISDCRFTYDAEQAEKRRKNVINSFGQIESVTDWDVKSIEGKEEDL